MYNQYQNSVFYFQSFQVFFYFVEVFSVDYGPLNIEKPGLEIVLNDFNKIGPIKIFIKS